MANAGDPADALALPREGKTILPAEASRVLEMAVAAKEKTFAQLTS